MPGKAKEAIAAIQHALAAKGFNPGVVDGIWGRDTETAVKLFQVSKGLVSDGIVGPKTSEALFGEDVIAKPSPVDDPAIPWFQQARHLLGTREKTGPGSNFQILQWATEAGIDYASDDIPWCGLFVAHCISSTLGSEKLPGNPLGARQWLKFGAPQVAPGIGSILVFWREDRNGFKGHVGFYAGEDNGSYHVLGGNQGDAVSIVRIARDRLLGVRWPATAPILNSGPIKFADAGNVFSTDEA